MLDVGCSIWTFGKAAEQSKLQRRFGFPARGRSLPSLFVIRGNDQGMRFDLEAERVTIGRESTNAIQLHDREVSRGHAEVIREGQQFTVADLQQ